MISKWLKSALLLLQGWLSSHLATETGYLLFIKSSLTRWWRLTVYLKDDLTSSKTSDEITPGLSGCLCSQQLYSSQVRGMWQPSDHAPQRSLFLCLLPVAISWCSAIQAFFRSAGFQQFLFLLWSSALSCVKQGFLRVVLCANRQRCDYTLKLTVPLSCGKSS